MDIAFIPSDIMDEYVQLVAKEIGTVYEDIESFMNASSADKAQASEPKSEESDSPNTQNLSYEEVLKRQMIHDFSSVDTSDDKTPSSSPNKKESKYSYEDSPAEFLIGNVNIPSYTPFFLLNQVSLCANAVCGAMGLPTFPPAMIVGQILASFFGGETFKSLKEKITIIDVKELPIFKAALILACGNEAGLKVGPKPFTFDELVNKCKALETSAYFSKKDFSEDATVKAIKNIIRLTEKLGRPIDDSISNAFDVEDGAPVALNRKNISKALQKWTENDVFAIKEKNGEKLYVYKNR